MISNVMECEFCKNDHQGNYGSGRFCNKKCARAFSTFAKRQEINVRVSDKLKNVNNSHLQNKEIRDKRNETMLSRYGTIGFRKEDSLKGIESIKRNSFVKRRSGDFESFCLNVKKKILIEENGYKCEWCKLEKWLDMPITLEIDHIDGNHSNNSKENFRLLCPNCHSFTPTFKNKKRSKVM
jgi:hypothetical protein